MTGWTNIYKKLLRKMLEIFPDKNVNTVYHYTSLDVLWEFLKPDYDFLCTYCKELSDPTEFTKTGLYACTRMMRKFSDGNFEEFAVPLSGVNALSGSSGLNLFPWTMSFSTASDETSQWKNYTDSVRGGCAIGFNTEKIISGVELGVANEGWSWVNFLPCVYVKHDSDELIYDLFQYAMTEVVGDLAETLSRGKDIDQGANTAKTMVFLLLASLMKHRDFHAEREWRLIVQPIELTHVAMDVKIIGGKSRVKTGLWGTELVCPIKTSGREQRMSCSVSQMKVNGKDMSNQRVSDMIERIIISPHGPSNDLLDRGELFVALRGLKNGDGPLVVPSESPYRGRL